MAETHEKRRGGRFVKLHRLALKEPPVSFFDKKTPLCLGKKSRRATACSKAGSSAASQLVHRSVGAQSRRRFRFHYQRSCLLRLRHTFCGQTAEWTRSGCSSCIAVIKNSVSATTGVYWFQVYQHRNDEIMQQWTGCECLLRLVQLFGSRMLQFPEPQEEPETCFDFFCPQKLEHSEQEPFRLLLWWKTMWCMW